MGGRRRSGIAVGTLLSALGMAATAEELPVLAPATLPLAIRDGRIAAITVRAVPFAPGRQDLAPEIEAALARLARSAATDCFLTAQAVGHARPGSLGDGDVLTAQRLAAARADLVQAALVRAGLPAKAIAAVSDYEFINREPRVTLWLFRLSEGDECRGQGLPTQAPELTVREDAAPPAPAAPEPPKTMASRATAPTGPLLASAEIRFDAGSSFLPRGAEQALQRLIEALPKDRAYRIALAAGIDDTQLREGDPAGSARFNRWLSERRLERVGDWLEQRAEIRELAVSGTLEERERSTRVVIRIMPGDAPAL